MLPVASSSIGMAENGEEVMAAAPGGGPRNSRHVAGVVLIAARRDHRLACLQELAHRDETVALLLQLRQRDGERRSGVAAAAIGMGHDDGAGMRPGQDGVGDGLGARRAGLDRR